MLNWKKRVKDSVVVESRCGRFTIHQYIRRSGSEWQVRDNQNELRGPMRSRLMDAKVDAEHLASK